MYIIDSVQRLIVHSKQFVSGLGLPLWRHQGSGRCRWRRGDILSMHLVVRSSLWWFYVIFAQDFVWIQDHRSGCACWRMGQVVACQGYCYVWGTLKIITVMELLQLMSTRTSYNIRTTSDCVPKRFPIPEKRMSFDMLYRPLIFNLSYIQVG